MLMRKSCRKSCQTIQMMRLCSLNHRWMIRRLINKITRMKNLRCPPPSENLSANNNQRKSSWRKQKLSLLKKRQMKSKIWIKLRKFRSSIKSRATTLITILSVTISSTIVTKSISRSAASSKIVTTCRKYLRLTFWDKEITSCPRLILVQIHQGST